MWFFSTGSCARTWPRTCFASAAARPIVTPIGRDRAGGDTFLLP